MNYGDENLLISGITYSVGYNKIIVKSGKRFFIGTFNDNTGKFDYEATFKLNHTRAVVNVSRLDTTDYIQEGISYYEGNLYFPMAKPDANDNASNVSVVTTYPLNISETINKQKNKQQQTRSQKFCIQITTYLSESRVVRIVFLKLKMLISIMEQCILTLTVAMGLSRI